jgi:WD40 repeat protein
VAYLETSIDRMGRRGLTFPAAWGTANLVAFSANGNRLAATASDGTARVWEAPAD